jgi:hypothetical protein
MSSLTLRLASMVMALLVPLQLAVGITSYRYVVGRDRALLDEELRRQASAVRQIAGTADANEDARHFSTSAIAAGARRDAEPASGFQYWGNDNSLHSSSLNLASLPLDGAPAGFADILIEGRRWRVFTALSDGRWIRVAQRSDVEDALARIAALQVVVLLGAGIPILLAVLSASVGHGLAPVRTLAEQISRCVPGRSGPIGPDGLPAEFEPIVASVNTLLAKVSRRSVH